MDQNDLSKKTMIGLSRKRRFIEKDPVDVVQNLSAQPPDIPDWLNFAYETYSNVEENDPNETICGKLALKKISFLLSRMEQKKCRPTNDSQVDSVSAPVRTSNASSCDSDILEGILRKEGMNALIRSFEREISRQRTKALRNATGEEKSKQSENRFQSPF
ncbi:Voltage-dependent calcium channel subunit alpha-2 [Trichuris trichiura]|uniref:Voltage-dependent calcium channel subunit alpha-2 n=1 Tax=Trichuris trichiura TaxID=36087 RepID=A0A077Z8A5_TRITR|nr:Voltage-dependent calcium channel subunit alpha-2 [Trichuris trichiura]